MRKKRLRKQVALWFRRRSNVLLLRRIAGIFSFFALIVGVPLFLFHTPLLSVQSVAVSDASKIENTLRRDIHEYIDSHLGEYSYFAVPNAARYLFTPKALESKLTGEFLKLQSASIEWDFLNHWIVHLVHRKTFGTYCAPDASCVLIGTDGVVFAKTDIRIGKEVLSRDRFAVGEIIFGENEIYKQAEFHKVDQVVRFLEENGIMVRQADISKDNRIVHLILESGLSVVFDAHQRIFSTTRDLFVFFKEIYPGEEIESIRFVNVVKPKSIVYDFK